MAAWQLRRWLTRKWHYWHAKREVQYCNATETQQLNLTQSFLWSVCYGFMAIIDHRQRGSDITLAVCLALGTSLIQMSIWIVPSSFY